jgi:hypothetical protein
MKTQKVKISEVKMNPNNPRLIKDDKFAKLVRSIKEFPKMLEIRPIVVNADMIVLGGNMRLKACKEAGLKEVPIIYADDLTEDEQKQFIIKDNVGFGEWDWDMIANEWESNLIEDWGLDIPFVDNLNIDNDFNNSENPYTGKVEAPKYEPSEEKPEFVDLYDKTKFEILVEQIESSSLNKEHKEFLKLAATRHIVFNYSKIADMYAHSEKQMQEQMENSALVIIDFEKAIELGFVRLSEEISAQFIEEYGNEE